MILAGGSFDQLEDVLLPSGGALVALAEIYVDESGSHNGSPILSIGGYVFLKGRSRAFRRAWQSEVRRKNAPYFHMTDCANGAQFYKDWSMAERIAHESHLIELTKKYSAFGFATGINESVYDDILGIGGRRIGSGYTFLLRHCLSAVSTWVKMTGFKGQCAYFFEAGHRDAAQANAVMTDIFSRPQFRKQYRYISHAFVDKMHAPPLQSADLLAWLARNAIMKLQEGRLRPRADFMSLLREWDRFRYYDQEMLTSVLRHLEGDKSAIPATADYAHYYWGAQY